MIDPVCGIVTARSDGAAARWSAMTGARLTMVRRGSVPSFGFGTNIREQSRTLRAISAAALAMLLATSYVFEKQILANSDRFLHSEENDLFDSNIIVL